MRALKRGPNEVIVFFVGGKLSHVPYMS
jgi:hypothetical protein